MFALLSNVKMIEMVSQIEKAGFTAHRNCKFQPVYLFFNSERVRGKMKVIYLSPPKKKFHSVELKNRLSLK